MSTQYWAKSPQNESARQTQRGKSTTTSTNTTIWHVREVWLNRKPKTFVPSATASSLSHMLLLPDVAISWDCHIYHSCPPLLLVSHHFFWLAGHQSDRIWALLLSACVSSLLNVVAQHPCYYVQIFAVLRMYGSVSPSLTYMYLGFLFQETGRQVDPTISYVK